MRSNLVIGIEQWVQSWQMTLAEAARHLGITQPRLDDLPHGRFMSYSFYTLIILASQEELAARIDLAEVA